MLLLYKIKDFFTSTYSKNKILYEIINNNKHICDIKYLSACGQGKRGSYPDDTYRLIKMIQQEFNIDTFNYGFWKSGCIIFNSIEIKDGECKIGLEFDGR
jgi:hypothetical protein